MSWCAPTRRINWTAVNGGDWGNVCSMRQLETASGRWIGW